MVDRSIKRLVKEKRLKRLIKANNVYDSVFKNLGKDGRDVLKIIEDYKYKVIQSLNIVTNDEQLSNKMEKYVEDLNNVSAFFYSFVFDMENYDIVDDCDKQIEFDVPKEETENEEETNNEETDIENVDNENNNVEDDNVDTENNNDEEDTDNEDNIDSEDEMIDNEENEDNENVDIDDLFEQAKENDENLE